MRKDIVSRREFLKRSGAASVAVTVAVPVVAGENVSHEPLLNQRQAIFAALGDTLIPTDPGDPGYKSLERFNITDEVMKGLSAVSDADLAALNQGTRSFFDGRTFLQLTESQRANYLRLIIDGSKFSDKKQLKILQSVYEQTRDRVFTLFYQNYPENVIPRDGYGAPLLKAGDKHQITNPNTTELVTGWDIAGFKGPLTWEEEEERRAKFRKFNWQE